AETRSPDLLPGEEGRGFSQDLLLLFKPPNSLAELSELLALGRRHAIVAFPAIELIALQPVTQTRVGNPQLAGNIRHATPIADQRDRALPELPRIRPRHQNTILPKTSDDASDQMSTKPGEDQSKAALFRALSLLFPANVLSSSLRSRRKAIAPIKRRSRHFLVICGVR